MKLRLYNTLSRQVEEFVPINPPKVGMYSCGPTVYWNQHIGHMYAYVQWDCLVRAMRSQGNEVKWVMNITDVGHLTSDEDAGEDKMEKGAKREGLTVWQIADKYIAQFSDSMSRLNIQKPDILCRATEHINEQIELIKKIEAKGFTYKTSTGIVFDTSKFPDYAKFAKLDLKKQEAGARVEVDPEKRQPWDFLLWVTNQPDHIMKWDSPWGMGFPGWHIECTAMSTKYLGEQFDIHTGGIEHVPVHHTNEIAQAFGAFGRQTANYWLHNGWLVFDGQKMSKSLGNNILVSDLEKKNIDPLALRYLILNSNYRKGLNFTWEALASAQNALGRLRNKTGLLAQSLQGESLQMAVGQAGLEGDFWAAVNDDLNFPEALGIVWKLVDDKTLSAGAKLASLLRMDRVLGLKLDEVKPVRTVTQNVSARARIIRPENVEIPDKVMKLVKRREDQRAKGNFSASDLTRDQIVSLGYLVEDTATGTVIKPFGK